MARNGHFVWYELLVDDVNAARAFYTETIGWKTAPFGEGPDPYMMWMVGEQPIGGVMKMPPEMKQGGAPAHWLAYVAVTNIDETCKKAQGLGGQVHFGPKAIPEVGKIAVLADPQGAAVGLLEPSGADMPMHEGEPRAGEVSWNELNTTDNEGALKFYSNLFGWQHTESMDMGPEYGKYVMFKEPGQKRDGGSGGMSNMAKTHKMPPHWLYYVHVNDLDATLDRVKAKGGKVLNGPMEVPGGDMIAQCMDPQGVAFALHAPKK